MGSKFRYGENESTKSLLYRLRRLNALIDLMSRSPSTLWISSSGNEFKTPIETEVATEAE